MVYIGDLPPDLDNDQNRSRSMSIDSMVIQRSIANSIEIRRVSSYWI